MPSGTPFLSLFQQGHCLPAPGVYDCVSAKIAEQAGFPAISISGYSVEASLLGLPDLGFSGLSDIEGVARRIADCVSLPIICDADTGYGGVNNVWRTVRCLEAAGVSALHIEDQAEPKKCGGLPGRKVVAAADMVAKVKAACDARRDEATAIIARSDAKESEGLAAVIDRLNAYLDAGADIAFAAESLTVGEVQRLGAQVEGLLAVCGGVPGWPGAFETTETYGRMGVDLVIYPFTSLFVAARAMQETYAAMARAGGFSAALAENSMVSFDAFGRFIGVDRWRDREAVFAPSPNGSRGRKSP